MIRKLSVTGAVGAFAVVREDVGDTLPGVAIAISLVPPLAVVGLTLESGAGAEAVGALLLFVANVAAILASGVAAMGLYGLFASGTPGEPRALRRHVVAVVALVVVVALPLAFTSYQVTVRTDTENEVLRIARTWAEPGGWDVLSVTTQAPTIVVRAIGASPAPDADDLRAALDAGGYDQRDVRVEMVPETRTELPAG